MNIGKNRKFRVGGAGKAAIIIIGNATISARTLTDMLVRLGCDNAGDAARDAIGKFNEELFMSAGCRSAHWTPFNEDWLASPKASEFLERADDLLTKTFGSSYLFIMDDWRLPRLLPFWNEVFGRAQIVPRFVFALAQAHETACPLGEQPGDDDRASDLLWLRSLLEAEAFTRGRERSFWSGQQAHADPVELAAALGAQFALVWPRRADEALATMVRPQPQQPAAAMRPAPEWLEAVHSVLVGWSEHGEDSEGQVLLDAVHDAFDDASPAFAALVDDAVVVKQRFAALEAQASAAQEALRWAELRASQMEAAMAQQTSQADARLRLTQEAAANARTVLQDRIAHLESAVAQRNAEVAQISSDLAFARRERDRGAIDLANANHRLAQAIDEHRQQLALRDRQLADAERERLRTQSDLVDAGLRLQQLVDEHSQTLAVRSEALTDAQNQARERVAEIVTLTRMLAVETANANRAARNAERLARIAHLLEKGAKGAFARRFGWLMPWFWHKRRQARIIEREALFDPAAYLAANPDVAQYEDGPLLHFLNHGIFEGRPLGTD